MWKIWRLKNRVREILTEKKGVGVVEVILILVVKSTPKNKTCF